MKKANAVWGLIAAAGLVIAPVAAASGAEFPENTPAAETVTEVAEVTEAPVVPAAEEAPIEPVAPVVIDEVPEVVKVAEQIVQEAFVPYEASARWLIPASWDYNKTPSYQAAIFPQTELLTETVPCNQWSQDDKYWIDSIEDEVLFNTLNDDGVLTQGEDSAIYKSHVFTKGPKCGPVDVVVPLLEVLPPSCDTDGSLPWTSNPAAQNPNGYEFPGLGFRVYLNKAYTGPGVYVATIQKIGAGFDPAFPYGTKVTGETKQTLTVLEKTGDCPAPANPTATLSAVCGAAEAVLTNPQEEGYVNQTASFVIYVDDAFYGAYAVPANESETVKFTFAEDTGDHKIEVYQAGTSEWALIAAAVVTSDCIEPPVVVPPVEEPPVTVDEPIIPAASVSVDALAKTGDDWVFWLYVSLAAAAVAGLGTTAVVVTRRNDKKASA